MNHGQNFAASAGRVKQQVSTTKSFNNEATQRDGSKQLFDHARSQGIQFPEAINTTDLRAKSRRRSREKCARNVHDSSRQSRISCRALRRLSFMG
jgi:hypothetical protein